MKLLYGTIKVGDSMKLLVDQNKHFAITKNHSATHLLQSALIKVLGNDIKQKGSFVNDEYLRFDFSHFEKISDVDLKKVERIVNEYISQGLKNNTEILPIEEAKKTKALCLFDEKYGDVVRVVSFGDISSEFCGGNHVKNTSDIGVFVIESEGSIANGIRRIQATTSFNAYEILKQREEMLNEVKTLVSANNYGETENRVVVLQNSLKDYEAKYNKLFKELSILKAKDLEKIFDNGHDLRCDYLKVGHHGSNTSTSKNLVSLISPKEAIISCGKDNNYGHPHKETLAILNYYNVKIRRTDLEGTIRYKFII